MARELDRSSFGEENAVVQSTRYLLPSHRLSGYITPIACQYCRADAHLINLSRQPEHYRTAPCIA
jgi:hypothetical protein